MTETGLDLTGYPMPDLSDEIAYYDSLGWAHRPEQRPSFGADPGYAIDIGGHIHDIVEGDGVWDNLMMYARTADRFFFDRAQAWAAYYKSAKYFELGGLAEALTTAQKTQGNSYGDPGVESQLWNDVRRFSGDHMTGWGLIALYVFGGRADQALLERARQFGDVLTDYVYADPTDVAKSRTRRVGRALQLLVPLYRETRDAKYRALLDRLVGGWTTGEAAPEAHGNGRKIWWATEAITGSTPYEFGAFGPRCSTAYGDRVQSTLVTAILAEGLWRAYLETKSEVIKDSLIAAARYVMEYAYDPVHGYVGSYFGIYHGHPFHNWADGGFKLSTGAADVNVCEYMSYRTSTDPLVQSPTSKLVFRSTDAADRRTVTADGSAEHSAGHALLQESVSLNGTSNVSGLIDVHRVQRFSAPPSDTAVITLLREDGSVVARLGPRLRFSGGSSEFAIGETITGGRSGATAVVEELLVLSGTRWNGNAAGYLVISGKAGTFEAGEPIASASGAAVVDGALEVPTERRLNVTIDGSYTLFLANLAVMGFKLTGEPEFKAFADLLYARGSKMPGNKRGDPQVRTAENEVNLFIDTTFEGGSSWGGTQQNQFHAKGFLQHTYLLFENGGNPSVIAQECPTEEEEEEAEAMSYLAEQVSSMAPGEWRPLDTAGYDGGGVLVTLSQGTILEYNRRAFLDADNGVIFTYGTSRSGLRDLAGTYTQSEPLNAADSKGNATIPGEYTIDWAWPTWEIKNGDQPTGQSADYGVERSAYVAYTIATNEFSQHRGAIDSRDGGGFCVTPERHAHCRYVSSGAEILPRYIGNHAWDYGDIDPVGKHLYVAGHGPEFMRRDLTTGEWEELPPRPGPATDKTVAATFFTAIDRYVRFVLRATSGWAYLYDPAGGTWRTGETFDLPANSGGGYRGSAFALDNPVHGFAYFSGGSKNPAQLFRFNPDETVARFDDCPADMLGADGRGSSHMVDPVSGHLLVAAADGTFWQHDPTAGAGLQWAQLANHPLTNASGNQWAAAVAIPGAAVGLEASKGVTMWLPGNGTPRPDEPNMRPWLYRRPLDPEPKK